MSRYEITVTVTGAVGVGKSAICGEIEILCKALGLNVEWDDDGEKNGTGADWTQALEMYKPSVRIVELSPKQVAAALPPPGRGMVPMEWQPIDTAPESGPILIVSMEARQPMVVLGCYPVEVPTGGTGKGDWYITSNATMKPTHWMPLPKPPAAGIAALGDGGKRE